MESLMGFSRAHPSITALVLRRRHQHWSTTPGGACHLRAALAAPLWKGGGRYCKRHHYEPWSNKWQQEGGDVKD